ncbi:MAG TPA: hypothetical protein VK211_20655 [Kamptonema sp.]|nr:hypothetical protein [Kamptonema sp.]
MLFFNSITRTKNLNETQDGVKQLREAIKQNLPRSAIESRATVINDLRQYINGQKVYDDFTLVVFKQK